MASLEELVHNKRVTYLRYKGQLYSNFSKCVSSWPAGFTRSEWEAQAGEFQAREDDIWLSSYQKSGEFPNLGISREIHPLDPQPHRHSMLLMLVPIVCAPQVTRCSLGKYWSCDWFRGNFSLTQGL